MDNKTLLLWMLCTFIACRCEAFIFGTECNGRSYSREAQFCCGDELYPIEPYTACCSGEVIDTRTSACYLGRVRHNPRNGCDGMYYSRTTEFCCDNHIYTKSPTANCCGSNFYNPTEYHCGLFYRLKLKRS